jgi:hypothetical protein
MTSIIKVDNLQNQCGANIINENAGTITIGASGDTVTLAAGASQSGFGRSGSVNWDTTPKTTGFTAVSGNGYFCDTTSAAFTVTLPATPSAGDIVAIADYNGTVLTNNITVGRNSSDINGSAADFTISKNYAAISFVYVDATAGWRSVDTSNVSDVINPFVAATGGCETTCGDYKIHTFTGPGTFTVTCAGNPLGSTTVDYLIIAGGGGGGGGSSGTGGGSGAGAGGFRTNFPSSCAGVPVTATAYPIVVGGGGAGGPDTAPVPNTNGVSGNNSSGLSITSAGGGAGRGGPCGSQAGVPGGSGGGASGGSPGCQPGGSGNTPPVAPPQGNPGGNGLPSPQGAGAPEYASAGGGGAGGAGQPMSPGSRAGGPGVSNSITGSPVTYSRGGTGGTYAEATTPISNEPANSGNGGFGKSTGPNGSPQAVGANGGSGIVVIRYKFQ